MFFKRISYVFVLCLFSFITVTAQEELNAVVAVNADRVQSTNKQVFNTLQQSLTEFINQTKWTNKKFLPQERINAAFTIIVNEQNGSNFNATLQIQASRPVYNSTYETPILNINDTKFNFQYNEFEPLIYNPNSFDSNLVSMIVFYVYIIIGVDADTFALKGGDSYLKQAQNVMLQAQQSGDPSWENQVGEQNRFALIDGLLSSKFTPLRNIYYNYHRKGFDIFADNELEAKSEIANSIMQLEKLFNITVGNYMIRVFLDAKSDEIVDIFSSGKTIGKEQKLKELLERIAPTQNNKWKEIKL
ncbi:type IX secretion system protein PorD [Tenacibaculum amylolyticum]|uniref:type IX secretion system protein PorD n=1 Tax=Tenacibaculum amylolyticum TaxID=104269 RepID=UPI003893AFC1